MQIDEHTRIGKPNKDREQTTTEQKKLKQTIFKVNIELALCIKTDNLHEHQTDLLKSSRKERKKEPKTEAEQESKSDNQ